MEKRYQVFISSTFQDLQGARQEVSQALLRADCFPAGMELFPAADEEQFEFIKTVIDQSDYYILISAGRYGSIHPETGLSYTEMEYDYAVETGKPVIRLLHKDIRPMADESDAKMSKLLAFREKLKSQRMIAFWETADQLGKEVVFALLDSQKRKPAIGWVRSDIAEAEVELTKARLKSKIAKLEAKPQVSDPKRLLSFDLPVVMACLMQANLNGNHLSLSLIWIPLEEAFNLDDTRDENELSYFFREHASIDDDDSRAIIDALVVDGVLAVTYNRLKLSKKGQEFLRVMRVKTFLEI